MPDTKRSRRSLRLKGYDYRTIGAYFVTICAYRRQRLFDDPVLHEIVEATWCALPTRFPTITLDSFVVMPNHIHCIIWLDAATPAVGVGLAPTHGLSPTHGSSSLFDVVCTYKSLVATTYLRWVRDNDPLRSARIWQRNYYERVIRNERELAAIRQYVYDNPQRWAEDNDNLDTMRNRGLP